MKDRKFTGFLKIQFVELPNDEIGTHAIAVGDWLHKRQQITKKPRCYYVSCNLKLANGGLHHVRLHFHDKVGKQDISVLMRQAFDIAKRDVDESVLLFESYFIISA